MSALTEAALLREVARVQNDKTLLAVRDLIDSIPVMELKKGAYNETHRAAKLFRADLISGIQQLKEA